MDLVWAPIAMFLSGVGVSFAAGAVSKRDFVFAKGLILSSASGFIGFVYWLSYWAMKEILVELAFSDAVTPVYGLVALLLIPFGKTILELAWRGMGLIGGSEEVVQPTSIGTLVNEQKVADHDSEIKRETSKTAGKDDPTKTVLKKLKELRNSGVLKPEIYELCRIYLTTEIEELEVY
jgi:DNA helicase HerA-like ATPase